MRAHQKRKSRLIRVGDVPVGGGSPVSIQSMTNTDTRNPSDTLAQIGRLHKAGCEIVRAAVPDMRAAEALAEITAKSPIPVIADIHFDHRLALASIKSGVHGLRINPGNIGSEDNVRRVAEAAGAAGIPIRVGANSGSLKESVFEEKLKTECSREAAVTAALVESALEECRLLENCGFRDIKVSLKSSCVRSTVEACRRFAEMTDHPMHLGVTEAGSPAVGIIKSAVGIGSLLLDGIGDTIRVSLTAPPEEEIKAAIRILESAGLREAAPEIVACPTCGRTEMDLFGLLARVEALVDDLKASGKKIGFKKIAVMGCVVNGPGEAKDADIGVAGGGDKTLLFKKGVKVGLLPESEAFEFLRKEILASCVAK